MRCLRFLRLTMLAACVLLAACQRQPPEPTSAPRSRDTTPLPATPAPVRLQDVSENTPQYMVGISYPPGVDRQPGLAVALKQYADAARAELMQAVRGIGAETPTAPYDLSLAFTEIANNPNVIAIAADGSCYTGGAHGNPLIARFVWLPGQQRMLTASALIPDPKAWEQVSEFAREQLLTGVSQRIDADEIDPADRAELLRSAGRMIDEGTAPTPANFAQFEPVLAQDGRMRALRFVFPPYQVGPYSDGTQAVEVPAQVLLPHIAPEYRKLFAAAG